MDAMGGGPLGPPSQDATIAIEANSPHGPTRLALLRFIDSTTSATGPSARGEDEKPH